MRSAQMQGIAVQSFRVTNLEFKQL